MEFTQEKSLQLASQIELMKALLHTMDLEYTSAMADQLHTKANRMDSMAPLIRNYHPANSRIMHMQATALERLVQYVDILKEIGEAKIKLDEEEKVMSEIADMFS